MYIFKHLTTYGSYISDTYALLPCNFILA